MKAMWIVPGLVLCAALCGGTARAAETDQFMTWGLEIQDSATVLNARFNLELDHFLETINRRTCPLRNPSEVTSEFFWYLCKGLVGSRYRDFIQHAENVEKYPARSISLFKYFRQSVYREPAFPFLLPMTRTIRVGEVYCGTDKIAHFLSFGRRYFQRHERHVKEGLSEEEATERVIRWGFTHEMVTVGGLVDGIVSLSDLEANYQGMRLAFDICGGSRPFVAGHDGKWRRVRAVDLREYITPDFDESYNLPLLIGVRKKQVIDILRREYASKHALPALQARFERYRTWPKSANRLFFEAYFQERGIPMDFDSWMKGKLDAQSSLARQKHSPGLPSLDS